jgi:hypothetical protein
MWLYTVNDWIQVKKTCTTAYKISSAHPQEISSEEEASKTGK